MRGGGYNKLDIFTIGIACSGGMSCKATEEYKRVQKMRISKMYYRGDGWPGKNRLVNSESMVEQDHQLSLFERMFSSHIFKNPGCRYCTDQFAEDADVSFCDFWNREEMKKEYEGNSCVIIRSTRASRILSEMQEAEYIKVVQRLSEQEVVDTQWHVLLAKKGKMRDKLSYKIFSQACDFIRTKRIYKFFRMKEYALFCKIHGKILKNVRL